MSTIVKNLPQGLREDSDLSNGIYVRVRNTDLSFYCTDDPEKKRHPIGNCPDKNRSDENRSDPQPKSVYIDDANSKFYVPLPNAEYRVMGEEDGIKNHYSFSDNFSSWWLDTSSIALKYVFTRVDSLDAKEIRDLLMSNEAPWRLQLEISARILEGKGVPSEIIQDWELKMKAAMLWLNQTNGETPYYKPAIQVLKETALNQELDGKKRYEAANEFFKRLPPEQFQEGWDLFVQLAQDTTVGNLRYDVADTAHDRATTDEQKAQVVQLFFALVQDKTLAGSVRLSAAHALAARISPEVKERLELYSNLAQDESLDGVERFNAAKTAYSLIKSPTEKRRVLELFVQLAQDRKVEDTTRFTALRFVHDNGSGPIKDFVAKELLTNMIDDPTLSDEGRFWACAYVVGDLEFSPDLFERALKRLHQIAKEGKVHGTNRYSAAQIVYKNATNAEEKSQTLRLFATIVHDSTLDQPTRREAIEFLLQEGEHVRDKATVFKAFAQYQKDSKGMRGWYERDVFGILENRSSKPFALEAFLHFAQDPSTAEEKRFFSVNILKTFPQWVPQAIKIFEDLAQNAKDPDIRSQAAANLLANLSTNLVTKKMAASQIIEAKGFDYFMDNMPNPNDEFPLSLSKVDRAIVAWEVYAGLGFFKPLKRAKVDQWLAPLITAESKKKEGKEDYQLVIQASQM